MSFTWPYVLLALLLIPLLIGAYVWLLRRRRKFAVRFASLSLIRQALPRRSRWRRHLPFALFLAGLTSLIVASARPQATVDIPTSRTTVLLVLDVSGSMCSTDVPPNRLTVAQQVARNFIKDRASGTKIGIVAFAGFAQVVVAPTSDKDALIAGIDGLTTGRGTAIGSALLKAIDTIAEVNPNVPRAGAVTGNGGPAPAPAAPPAGTDFQPDVVVLLTDGASNLGVNPLVAAQQAADRGLRVYTISFGTDQPSPLVCTRNQLGADTFGRGGGPGGPGGFGGRPPGRFQQTDDQALQDIAEITGGEFHTAGDASQLNSVFRGLPAEITRQQEEVEFSVAFTALGALLAIAAVGLSLAWNRYP